MSISRRLQIAFACMIAIMTAIGVVGLLRVGQLDASMTRLVRDRYGKVALAERAVTKVNANARTALHLFMFGDTRAVDQAIVGQLHTSGELTAMYAELMARADSPEERSLLSDIEHARAHYLELRAVAEALLRAGDPSQAKTSFDVVVLPALNHYLATCQALLEFEGRKMGEAATAAHRAYESARTLTEVLFAAGVAIGAVVAFGTTRRTTRPIRDLVLASERLERGDLTARVETSSVDELGVLARAFNRMGDAVAFRHERLEREMSLARHIQTAVLPRAFAAPGLELAGAMEPATEVGGDYFDVLASDAGCWLGIGDVAGHGLDAGLVMLMLQSSVAALVRANPGAAPRDVLCTVNRILHDNLHERLSTSTHATLNLLRVDGRGTVVHAGAHEEVLVWRAAERRCELIDTVGTWVGAVADVGTATKDATFALGRGDVMVLFTDGVTEAANATGEMFGVERLAAVLEASCELSADRITANVFGAVTGWAVEAADDRSVVVARFRGEG